MCSEYEEYLQNSLKEFRQQVIDIHRGINDSFLAKRVIYRQFIISGTKK